MVVHLVHLLEMGSEQTVQDFKLLMQDFIKRFLSKDIKVVQGAMVVVIELDIVFMNEEVVIEQVST